MLPFEMDVLKVVQQLRDLAADPQNRATIVRVRCAAPVLSIMQNYMYMYICIYMLMSDEEGRKKQAEQTIDIIPHGTP